MHWSITVGQNQSIHFFLHAENEEEEAVESN
jgi:hypothetical protein